MPVLTLRPNEVLSQGTWTVIGPGGTTAASALSDDNDATYIQNTALAQLDTQVCKVGLSDVDLPDGSRIFSVGVRVRIQQVPPDTGGGGGGGGGGGKPAPRCLIIWIQKVIYFALTRQIEKFWRTLFSFECPRPPAPPVPTDPPPPVTWETVELARYLQQPAGGEWSEQSFNDFVLGLGRDDADDPARISAVYIDIDYNTPPVATITDPSGSITDTTTPTAMWSYMDQEADRQQSWNVRVFSQEQYEAVGFNSITSTAFTESGWTVGEDSQWTIDKDLVNGTWRAYVQVQQVWLGFGEHRSTPTFVQWTQNVPGPPAPTLTALFEEDLNRVRIELAEGGPSPATISYNIEASDDAGLTWDIVRDGLQIGVSVDSTAQLWDYEAPIGLLRTYRAQAFRQLGGIRVASGFSNTATALPKSTRFWLKDVLVPTRNMILPVQNDEFFTPRDQGNFRPIVNSTGTARVIPVIGPAYGREGTLTVIFTEKDPAGWFEQFRDIWLAGDTLLYQQPIIDQFYIALGERFEVSGWRLSGNRVRYRQVKVDYVEVTKPSLIKPFEIVTT